VLSIIHRMETIQVVLEKALLEATDRAARRRRVNRSALVREALRAHLARLAASERVRRDREGYARQPSDPGEFASWNKVASWPDE
jgi:metal-responsive CopG/Arc/MetJ family transcriptional regulator